MIGPLTNFEKVQEFHKIVGASRNIWKPNNELVDFRLDLIAEEFDELTKEFKDFGGWLEKTYIENPDKVKVAKELADLLYVVYGTADTFDIDIDRVFEEVHRSNMSKLVDGKPLKRKDGKVLKGPNYTPPNLSFIGE